LENWWEAHSLYPDIELSCESVFCSAFVSIIVDMIETEKFQFSLATAGAFHVAVAVMV
jgi:hypothetical protein